MPSPSKLSLLRSRFRSSDSIVGQIPYVAVVCFGIDFFVDTDIHASQPGPKSRAQPFEDMDDVSLRYVANQDRLPTLRARNIVGEDEGGMERIARFALVEL